MAVWFLANQEVFRSVGNLFGMPSKGTAHYCIMEILHILADNMRSDYIRWPNKQQQYLIAEDFSQRYGFPNVVGCIDGTHVPVKAPSNDRESYVNRKGFPSVNVMAVCDNKMRFTDVFADRAGSVHDARVLRVSPLGAQLECNNICDPEYHILGDSAYPLLPQLMVPYRDNSHLTATQIKYNSVHSETRSVVERAFARLKGKFRRLRGLDCTRISNSLVIIEAAFVLHNFILAHENDDGGDDEFDQPVSNSDNFLTADHATPAAVRQAAVLKRDNIATMFH
jgi:hypothetical protein